jgi:3-deoxy-D-manno-octulosonate 8-phosphate phosphatase (KDO 8-P phosphatase)
MTENREDGGASGLARAAQVQMLALDVDGVMTDGRILYASNGDELKAFNIRDGLGIKLLQKAGVQVAIITGRCSPMVERRARELGISHVIQGREDKRVALRELAADAGIELAHCAYMGDDLPDLGAIRAAGLGMTVGDAAGAVARAADWQSNAPGGHGAVREACEFLLQARGVLADMEEAFES